MSQDTLFERLIGGYIRVLRRPIMRWMMAAYLIGVFGYLAFRIWPNHGDLVTRDLTPSPTSVERLLLTIEALETRDAERSKQLADLTDRIKGLQAVPGSESNAGQVGLLAGQIATIDKDLQSLKKALNPTQPDEILTVARLGDKFELIQSQLSTSSTKLATLESSVDTRIQRGYDLVNAQIDRIVDMIKWAGLLLLPIIFNTVRDLVGGAKNREAD